MKFALFSAAFLAGSASAFAPVHQDSRAVTSLNAEMSKALPFMKRPPLVSTRARLLQLIRSSNIPLRSKLEDSVLTEFFCVVRVA